MPIHITVDKAVDWAANRMLTFQDSTMSAEWKRRILPVSKYNMLVNVFNASTVLLVAAVASAVLFAYTAAFVLGAIAIFARLTSEKELHHYAIPQNQEGDQVHLGNLA